MRVTMLIVEDDEGLRTSLLASFTRRGHAMHAVPTLAEARRVLQSVKVDLVLLDNRLPDGTGLALIEEVRDLDPDTAVVVMTAFPEVRVAVRAMKLGACDFVSKPFDLAELQHAVERALEARALRRRVQGLERERRRCDAAGGLLGEHPLMEQVRQQIRKVAASDLPVLVLGPTGTGKELVADEVHGLSPRADRPLIKVNCCALSPQLLESELFGHERGAYTDAKAARAGLFEMSDGGTLFLDEVAEMRPELQTKLLRVIEGHPFHRLGGQRQVRADVRIVAATNRDLQEQMRRGELREDLFFRLSVFPIAMPPLRERGQDIILLARHFLARVGESLKRPGLRLDEDAQRTLLRYAWPGNVRELRNVIERAAVLCEDGPITRDHLPTGLSAAAAVEDAQTGLVTLAEMERRYVAQVLAAVEGNQSAAARVLGIARNTLRCKLRPAQDLPPGTQDKAVP